MSNQMNKVIPLFDNCKTSFSQVRVYFYSLGLYNFKTIVFPVKHPVFVFSEGFLFLSLVH